MKGRLPKSLTDAKFMASYCPGTFGELFQGPIAGRPTLITIPIDSFSIARFSGSSVSVPQGFRPAGGEKAAQAVRLVEERFQTRLAKTIEVQSELIPGKGCASSSADIVCAVMLALEALGVNPVLRPSIICQIASRIEPTDGVMYPGQVIFDYVKCKVIQKVHGADFQIVGVLLDGSIDSASFSSATLRRRKHELLELESAFELVRSGLVTRNLKKIGEGSTRSAVIHNRHLPKRELNSFIRLKQKFGAAGVIVAHSGTALGLIFPEGHRIPISLLQEMEDITGVLPNRYKTFLAGPVTSRGDSLVEFG